MPALQDATQDTDWSAVSFIQPYFKAVNERARAIGGSELFIPDIGTDIQKGGTSTTFDGFEPHFVTSITRSGSTATVTVDGTFGGHGYLVGDIVCITNAAQRPYSGLHEVLTVPTSTTFTFAVDGAPATPATAYTGSIQVAACKNMHCAIGAVQSMLQATCTGYMNTDHELIENANKTDSWSWTLSTWRASADINSSGFRRKKPRNINSTSATSDLDSNTAAHGQKAYGASGTDAFRGLIYRYNSGTSLWEPTETSKSVTSITRSGTKATVTVTAHGYQNGDVVRIAGATQTAYNGDWVITITGTNTFTYDGVTGSPATPATGTITSAALIKGPPDLLDSDSAAPDHCAYGTMQAGDYIGPWIFNQLKAGLDLLIKSWATSSENAALRASKGGSSSNGALTYAQNVAAAQAAYTTVTGLAGAVNRFDANTSTSVSASAHTNRLRAGSLSVALAGCEIDFYIYTEKLAGSDNIYDANGTGYLENAWNHIDTVGREGDTATTTKDASVDAGTLAFPNAPSDPGPTGPAVIQGFSAGVGGVNYRHVLRWNIVGGFEYYSEE